MLNTKTMLQNISKGQSSIPLRYIIQGLESDYNSLKSNIYIIYVNKQPGKCTVYFKVPSSSVPKLEYDCVFEFQDDERVTSNTEFKVYCNSPSFYFRYGNIFKRHGSLLYPEKYPKLIDVPAEVRNSAQVTGFDKYVYSCLRIATQLNVQEMIDSQKSNSVPGVDSFEEKQNEYRRLKRNKK